MNLSDATNDQLKNIIEWDNNCPALLLYKVYEESVKREVHKGFVLGCITKFFRSFKNAENLTKMTIEELKWFCYEKGFEALKLFKPGNRPFIALWSRFIIQNIRVIARDQQAQKRTVELVEIDHVGDWILPPANHNTETTALNRIYIESLLNRMTETEKQIAIKRYEGFTLDEIAKLQGVTKSGIQKRIKLYVKRLREEVI